MPVYNERIGLHAAADIKFLFSGEGQHLAAYIVQELRIVRGFLAVADDGNGLTLIKHTVAGRTIAHSPAEKLRLARTYRAAAYAACNDNGACRIELAPDGYAYAFTQRYSAERTTTNNNGVAFLKLLCHCLYYIRATAGYAGIIRNAFGKIQFAALRRICDNAGLFASIAGRERRRDSGRPGADDEYIKLIVHFYHL